VFGCGCVTERERQKENEIDRDRQKEKEIDRENKLGFLLLISTAIGKIVIKNSSNLPLFCFTQKFCIPCFVVRGMTVAFLIIHGEASLLC
jgi:hypothetical protein